MKRVGARWTAALLLAVATALVPRLAAGQGVPPDARWLAFRTTHFNVTYVEGLEPIARRAAARAEWAYDLLSREFVSAPDDRIEIVVADNVDFSNGMANPFPRNRIIAYALPPAGEPTLAYSDDWLQLLMLHELVHIFHLDNAGGVWRPLRGIFGRDPTLFPQIFSPGWVVEGLATYFETAYTTAGRARGSIYDMILRAAILEDAFFDIDRATLDPISWPSASTRYVYGALFIDHLASRFGAAAVPDFVERVGRQLVPYRSDAAARGTFGTTLTAEWRAWEDSLRARYAALTDSLSVIGLTEPDLLTAEGRFAQYPRHSPDGSRLVYSANTGRDDPGHVILSAAGGERLDFERRSALGPGAWLPATGELLFAQLDFDGPYRLFSDLYLEDPTGRARKVTDEARIWDADPRPGSRTAVAVQSVQGTNALALVDLDSGAAARLTEPSFDAYWAGPRWSPDGARIAAGVWRAGGRFDVVLLDAAGAIVGEIAGGPFIDADPAWSPDGRFVLFSSDRTGIPNLFARDVATGDLFQVTNVLTGAFQPDVSPDGRWIVFSYYRSDGYHIARIPFEPGGWRPVTGSPPAVAPPVPFAEDQPGGLPPAKRYSPFPSVLPTFWTLATAAGDDFAVGAAVSGKDVIERHSWGAEILGYPADRRVAGEARYRYAGLGNPALDVAVGQGWAVDSSGDQSSADVLRREREGSATLTWLRRRWSSTTSLQLGADLDETDFFRRADLDAPDRRIPLDAGSFVGVGYSTVRGFGLSLGPQEGFLASARLQARRYLEAPEGTSDQRNFWRLTTRGRAYRGIDWFGFAPPTLAARVDAGVESHTSGAGFSLGGAGGQGTGLPIQPEFLGRSIAYPLRGYSPGAQRGNRVVSASAEYRFPIALVERGFRLFPLSVDRLTGDLFLDAGAAWCSGICPGASPRTPTTPDPLLSVGAEAILTLRAGYLVGFPLRAGVALPLTEGNPRAYLRVGAGF